MKIEWKGKEFRIGLSEVKHRRLLPGPTDGRATARGFRAGDRYGELERGLELGLQKPIL